MEGLQASALSILDESQLGGDLELFWAVGLSGLMDACLPDLEDLQKSTSSAPGERRVGEDFKLFGAEGICEL